MRCLVKIGHNGAWDNDKSVITFVKQEARRLNRRAAAAHKTCDAAMLFGRLFEKN